MSLSQEEKDRIVEEETLRLETRMKLRENAKCKGGACVNCGQVHRCGGCRFWAWIFGALLILMILRFTGFREECSRIYDRDPYARNGWNPRSDTLNPDDSISEGDQGQTSKKVPGKQ